MAYRIEEHRDDCWAKVAICELDKEWQPVQATNRLLNIPRPVPHSNLLEDPRLYDEDGALMLSFIAATVGPYGHVATQGKCYLHPEALEASGFFYPDLGNNRNYAFNGCQNYASEKNWTFHDELIVYRLNPLSVYEGSRLISQSRPAIDWKHGNLSGSTPLVPFEGKLLGMFHSFQHDHAMRRHYHTGWYVLDPLNWRMTAISQNPVLSAQDGSGDIRPPNQQWRPNVVFPCGLIDSGDELALSYGWQDSTCCISFFSKDEVLSNLTQVKGQMIQKEALNDPYVTIPLGFDCEVRGHKLHARSWPKLLVQARNLGIQEQELHDQLVRRVRPEERKLVWANE